MKQRPTFSLIIKLSGMWMLVFALVANASATAVRPRIVSQTANGEILGGYIETSPQAGGRSYLGSTFADSSADGNLVVFVSNNSASAFDPNVADFPVANSISNVFVRNVSAGTTTCVSCRPVFGLLRTWTGGTPRITADGRYVVYSGFNLNDISPTVFEIFRVDLQTGAADEVSVSSANAEGNQDSAAPVISDNGRFVAFTSAATNLVSNYQPNNTTQLFVRDMQTGQTVLASHAADQPNQPANASVDQTQPLSISANGRFVVWTSQASNYQPSVSDTNNANDVFFFDTASSGSNIGCASRNTGGTNPGNGDSYGGVVAAGSGNFPPAIVFASNATDLNPADTNTGTDIYCFGSGSTRLISIGRDGGAANAASSIFPGISRSGRYVAFSSKASNLVAGIDEPSNTTPDVFLRDLTANTTRYASLNSAGQPASTTIGAALFTSGPGLISGMNSYVNRNISDDGRFVAFTTSEPLSVRDNAGSQDVYVRDLTLDISVLASLNKNLNGGQNAFVTGSSMMALTPSGRRVFYTADANNLAANDSTTVLNPKVFLADITLMAQRSVADANGDGENDFTVFRPSDNGWYTLTNPTGDFSAAFLGESGDRIVPGDFDGDGKMDQAVFNPTSGRWDILHSGDQTVSTSFFGTSTDVAAPADYDGDGRTDLAYFRPSSGTFYILQSNNNALRSVHFGQTGDVPVPGDYDGDNRADLAIFRPATGQWFVLPSLSNVAFGFQWGISTDKPVVGDFDGDGKSDAAVFRAGTWYILSSRDGSYRAIQWGLSDDRPVVSDYDGDGQTDVAVYRPSNATWYALQSATNSLLAVQWGTAGDVPVPAAYVP
jgi:hypothetical protein